MRFLLGVLSALIFASVAAAQPVNTGHLTAELVAQTQGVQPGGTTYVALRQQIQKGWHTYWRNPGDSGEATKIIWTLPTGFKAGEFVWPAPHRLPVGPLVNYGYSDEVILPMQVTAPADARPGSTVVLKGKAEFLVCADICIPESAELELKLPVVANPPPMDPVWGGRIGATLAAAPRAGALTGAFQVADGVLKLAVTGPPLRDADMADAYFFPFSSGAIDHAKPQAIDRGREGLTLSVPAGYELQAGTPTTTLAGVLVVGGKGYELAAAQGPLPPSAAGLGPPPARTADRAGVADLGLVSAAAFALLGGLILNLMPCVFPVLAMKAASLAGHGGAHGEARKQGLAFGAGVLATFLALAGLLIVLRAAGSAVGWGFQLQDPPVVAALALLMLLVALNLSGVFDVGASVQGVGSSLTTRSGLAGSFFTGALAVVVAAPCTAPFMGPALGWALTQTPVAALTVFLALGVGFAAPFVLVAFVPEIVDRLPRPGPWMDGFKKLLAFPMYGAVVWLVWVLTVQIGADAVPRILGSAVVLALAAWLYGVAQKRVAMGARPAALMATASALAVVAVVGGAVWPAYAVAEAAAQTAKLDEESYTPERLSALRAEGRPVLVNYTAAWCVSCQVNDRTALSTKAVAEALKRNNAVYLKADWTKRDGAIAAELARFGRAGVPLYLVYSAKGGEPAILPSLLTPGIVVKALDDAGKAS